jgi:hypothetical protein
VRSDYYHRPTEPLEPGAVDSDGWLVGPNSELIGMCNACGEEADEGTICCEDGEVVPHL